MSKLEQYNKAYEDIMHRQQTAEGKRRMALARIGVAYEDVRSRVRARITTREDLYAWQLYFNRLIYDLAVRYHLTSVQVEEYLARNYGTKTSSAKTHRKKRKEDMYGWRTKEWPSLRAHLSSFNWSCLPLL